MDLGRLSQSFRFTRQDPEEFVKSKTTLRSALVLCLSGSLGFFVLSPVMTFLFGDDALSAILWKSVLATIAGALCWLGLALLPWVRPSGTPLAPGLLQSRFPWLPLPLLTLMIFLLWSLLCSALSKWPMIAFFGNGWRHEGWVQYLAYAGMFAATAYLSKKGFWVRLRSLWFVSAVVACFVGLAEQFGLRPFAWSNGGSSTSFFINSNHFAYFLCTTAVLASAVWIQPDDAAGLKVKNSRKLLWSIASPALAVLLFTTLVYAQTRGATIALFGGLLLLGFFAPGKRSLRSFLPLGTAVAVFVALYFLDGALSTYKIHLIGANISSILSDPSSQEALEAGGSRWLLWVKGIGYFLQSPWIGIGPDTTGFFLQLDGIQFSDRLHNEYLEYLVTLGVPGLLAWLSFLFAAVRPALPTGLWRIRRRMEEQGPTSIEAVAAACAALTYLASAFFGNSLPYTAPFLFLVLGRCVAETIPLRKI